MGTVFTSRVSRSLAQNATKRITGSIARNITARIGEAVVQADTKTSAIISIRTDVPDILALENSRLLHLENSDTEYLELE